MAIASIKEVAKLASVSVGTVSNVLNRPDAVSPATRERVLNAMNELGFVRNESARALRSGRTRTMGLVVLDVTNPFFTDVAKGVEAVAADNGMIVTLCNSDQDGPREHRYLHHLEEQRVQGILITPVERENERLEQIIERGTPVVLLDHRATRRNRCSVAVDDVLGGRLATEHLLAQGHRRLGFVGGSWSISQVAERHKGAAQAVEAAAAAFRRGRRDQPGEAGLATEGGAAGSAEEPSLTLIDVPSLSFASGRHAAERLAAMPVPERPTALFCANDLLALGLMHGLTAAGLRIPGDVALIGYDDIDYAAAAAVPLSSIRQPREELGRVAAELLLEEIDEGERHRHRQVLFDPELVVRDSSVRR
ncbi:LacI family DNA-binding transcriptional regulator [Nonomuraea rhodomycinica]|uniref:LacI family DNA-binding transcriptional regulator n=1 Tax=Nonomuraea rhodomycinica TaxID=1712872 RepID=A0A7Y6INM6_9ACTN|nr:LacI family DNA-binding transcriptional regulator [Nonomuraea rhodomycinica]NUW40239.1 LacI family DNA-binding transcriptional regulator [Nonomuraea rhodomycinica]